MHGQVDPPLRLRSGVARRVRSVAALVGRTPKSQRVARLVVVGQTLVVKRHGGGRRCLRLPLIGTQCSLSYVVLCSGQSVLRRGVRPVGMA